MKRLVLVRREQPLRGGQPLSFLIGLVVALLAGILLLAASGHNPIEIYERLFNSSVGSSNAWAKTLIVQFLLDWQGSPLQSLEAWGYGILALKVKFLLEQ